MRFAVPLQVRQNGIIIFVPKYGIEGPVYLTAKGADAEAAFAMDEASPASRPCLPIAVLHAF